MAYHMLMSSLDVLQCSLKISSASRGCKFSCCSLFCTLYLGKINFNRMHWFELIINGSSKLMKEGCAYTTIYLLHSIFMLVRGASPKTTNILLDGVGSSIINRSIKLVM